MIYAVAFVIAMFSVGAYLWFTERGGHVKFFIIAGVAVTFLGAFGPKVDDGCFVDWDGRSNQVACN